VSDPLFRILANLPQAEPDRDRASRIRARCHAALAADRQRGGSRAPRGAAPVRLRETVLAGLGGAYLMATIWQGLLLLGIV
jgi:hypothetical protein